VVGHRAVVLLCDALELQPEVVWDAPASVGGGLGWGLFCLFGVAHMGNLMQPPNRVKHCFASIKDTIGRRPDSPGADR